MSGDADLTNQLILIVVGGILGVVLSAAVRSIGWFASRHFRKDSLAEEIARTSGLVDLQVKMKENKLTFADLGKFADELRNKKRVLRQIEDRVDAELHPTATFETQTEMNAYAYASAERAERKMEAVFAELRSLLDETAQVEALDKAQEAWRRYRKRQSIAAGLEFEGGSMRPLIEASEQERVTVQRTALLIEQLEGVRAERASY